MLQWIYKKIKIKKTAAIRMAWLAAFLFVFISCAAPALAQQVSGGDQSVNSPNSELNQGVKIIQPPLGLPAVDVRLIVARVIRIALGLLGIVMLVLILYAGFLWMTAGGNEEQINNAKKILTNAVIGLVIILSAYAIVLFVFRLLGLGNGGALGPSAAELGTQNFAGSGALGKIIKDHYPSRGQVDVPRNTKIVITFRLPIKLDSFVESISGVMGTDGKPLLGSCKNIGENLNWLDDCDRLINMDNDHINITRVDTGAQISGANVLASYQNGKVYTIVIRPFDNLGSDAEKLPYRVHLGKSILLDDPANNNPSAFNASLIGNAYYEWQFFTDTKLDTTPPTVNSVFPGINTKEAKNSVIQIDFTEPVNPIGIQGEFSTTTEGGSTYFTLDGNHIFSKSGHSSRPSGQFVLTNGYRTLEFTPDIECGTNACGGKIYCLPVCDLGGCGQAAVKQDDYRLITQAARTVNNASFESIPFSGVEDLSGNALDGDKDGNPQRATTTMPVFDNWITPDNYSWAFILKDEVDLTSPYLQKVVPGLDAEFVSALNRWQYFWSKRMRVDPMYDIDIIEHPTPAERRDNVPLCKVPRLGFDDTNGTSFTSMDHCPFLAGIRQYYYPVATSSIEDVHFNCFYPGLGPGGGTKIDNATWSSVQSRLPTSLTCGPDHPEFCCDVTSTANQAFCCNGQATSTQNGVQNCSNALNGDSPL